MSNTNASDSGRNYEGPERRRSPRRPTSRIVILVANKGVIDGNTIDISLEGFGGEVTDELSVGDMVHVYIQDDDKADGRPARVVRKTGTGKLGFEFIEND